MILEYFRSQNSGQPLQGCVLTTGVWDGLGVAECVEFAVELPDRVVWPPISTVTESEVLVMVALADVVALAFGVPVTCTAVEPITVPWVPVR